MQILLKALDCVKIRFSFIESAKILIYHFAYKDETEISIYERMFGNHFGGIVASGIFVDDCGRYAVLDLHRGSQ